MGSRHLLVAGLALITMAGCARKAPEPAAATAPAAQVSADRLLAASDTANAGQWMSHGRDYSEQRFSPLDKVNTDNVTQLGLAWFADFDTRRGQESTPLMIDGAIYVTTAWSKLYAFDARSGKELWKFDPKVPGEWAVNACCDVVNRGVAAWNGKVYLATVDARLIALDAATGRVVWDISTIEPGQPYAITGAPRIAKGKVLIGQGGSEFSQRGYLSAYDAETGKLDWRWYVVPGDPSKPFEQPELATAAKTWSGEWWKTGGGGAPWDGIVYDPATDYVYVGTGNGAPWPSQIRSPGGGDQLYLSSVVALDVNTGKYIWHYQATPNESWDYDNTSPLMTADLTINGANRHVVMQAPKNGFFYVLDAKSGELLSADAYVPGINWAKGIDKKTGRPIPTLEANYSKTGKGALVSPYYGGAHNWQPISFSPKTGLVYIPANQSSYAFVATHEDDNPMGQKLSISFAGNQEFMRKVKKPPVNEGFLLAWDPVQKKEAWRAPLGSGRSGGALSTAGGLVFAGNSENQFAAYRADTGAKLWSTDTQTGTMAGPISYALEGEQYVAVVAGFRQTGNYYAPNYSRLLVYKMGGTAKLPQAVPFPDPVLNPPTAFGSPETLKHGEEVYGRFCSTCHGTDGLSRGMFPDLRYSPALTTDVAFKQVVLDGVRAQNGMVSFAKALTPADAESVRAYLVGRAQGAKAAQAARAAQAAAAQPHGQ
ncbi:MAG TPA: PQQ-dependent dehydrogenase, methanol/ethanol family [Steroidobacteraceae bacterium]|nr:PQQ-dependent dehydrogenase, methanol/ethanol family [Steroidobacteraceae bacterium]